MAFGGLKGKRRSGQLLSFCRPLPGFVEVHVFSLIPRCFIIAVITSLSAQANAAELSKNDASHLALAIALEHESVTVVGLAGSGKLDQVLGNLHEENVRVVDTVAPIGYFAAVAPVGRVSSILEIPGLDEIDVAPLANVREWAFSGDRSARDSPAQNGQSARIRNLPEFPFAMSSTIHRDLNAQTFLQKNPSYDGRGVVIAQVEGPPDPLADELQDALSLEGEYIPKIADVTASPRNYYRLDPDRDIMDYRWSELSLPTERSRVGAQLGLRNVRLPGVGPYRVAQARFPTHVLARVSAELAEAPATASTIAYASARRPQHPADPVKLPLTEYDALYRPSDGAVWLDTNRNGDFSDEVAGRRLSDDVSVVVLGKDKPETARRESIAVIVEVDPDGDHLIFSLADSSHANMVASTAAASSFRRGRIRGAAPGAQLVVYEHGWHIQFARGLIGAFSDPRADIVLIEGLFPVTGGEINNSGVEFFARLVNRLVGKYGKLAVVTASNTPGVSSIADICVASSVICVGAYQSNATTMLNQGIDLGAPDSLHWMGSAGPAANGALKPDILAPANNVVLGNPFSDGGFSPTGLYRPVPGYGIGVGTSNAAPAAAGALALLLSAAQQEGLDVTAKDIKRAVYASARFVTAERMRAYQQGRGVIDVTMAWQALRAIAGGWRPAEIRIEGPVSTAGSHGLVPDGTGPGLFEREGWAPGDSGLRSIVLRRLSGPDSPVQFDIVVKGNDETFTLPMGIELPLNQPVSMNVGIKLRRAGIHSANVFLVAEGDAFSSKEFGLNIIAPEDMNAENGFHITKPFNQFPAERKPTFFPVSDRPDGLWVRARSGDKVANSILATPLAQDTISYSGGFPGAPHADTGLSVVYPIDGVWEYTLVGSRYPFQPYDWRAHGDTVDVQSTVVDIGLIDAEISKIKPEGTVSITNTGIAFAGGLASSAKASIKEETLLLSRGGHRVSYISVPNGAEILGADIDAVSDAGHDVDIYLYYCGERGGACRLIQRGRSFDSKERVYVDRPPAGLWKVITYSMAKRGTRRSRVTYRDYFSHPKLGRIVSSDPILPRDRGERWIANYTCARGDAPTEDGRRPADVFKIDAPFFTAKRRPMAGIEPSEAKRMRPFRKNDGAVPVGLKLVQSDCSHKTTELHQF